MNQAQHTFVIPAYKDSPYIEDCINSLLSQTVRSNILITSSTSTFFIEEISKKYNIEYFINPISAGLANDWNFALTKAKSKYVTIAHQDDIYEKDYTKIVLEKIERYYNQTILIAFTDYFDLYNGEKKTITRNSIIKKILLFPFLIKSNVSNVFLKKAALAFGNPICCPSVTINLAYLPQFSFSTEFKGNTDWFAWITTAKKEGSFLYIRKKLISHRVHAESETSAQLRSGLREKEEYKIFELTWGKRIAKLLMVLYTLSHKDNII
ncbi:MAG: glycosyltransferase [Bacteroidota bacterium]